MSKAAASWKAHYDGCVVACESQDILVRLDEPASLPDNAVVSLVMEAGPNKISFERAAVVSAIEGAEITDLRIRVFSSQENTFSEDKRARVRWPTGEGHAPSLVCQHPLFPDQLLFFKVINLSMAGLLLESVESNVFVSPGMELEGYLHLPGEKPSPMALQVRRTVKRMDRSAAIELGARIQKQPKGLAQALGNYLAHFAEVSSLEDLTSSGFEPVKVASAVSFSYVNDESGYRDALEVRRKFAAMEEGVRAAAVLTIASMADEVDAKSRIVNGYFRGKAVCTCRLSFHAEGDQLEAEKSGLKIPDDLFDKSLMVEVSKSRVMPGFRGFGISTAMLRFIVISAIRAGKETVILSTRENLVPLFKGYGFRAHGSSFTNKSLRNIEHRLMYANVRDLVEGKGVNPITWNAVWSPVLRSIGESNEFSPSSKSAAFRLAVYKFLGPASMMVKGFVDKLREEQISNQRSAATA
jgi:predicted GNAT family N-acyltransferase